MMVETRPAGGGLFGFGLFWLSLFFSPPSDYSFLPSTMTWAPCHTASVLVEKMEDVLAAGFEPLSANCV